MRHIIIYISIFALALLSVIATAQEKRWELSGYANAMPSLIVQSVESPAMDTTMWLSQVLVHNRLNFSWQASDHLRLDAGVRNRLITGSEAMIDPTGIGADPGWVDLSWNLASGNNALLNTSFDRLNATYERKKWKLQLGRQRINWGQTFVWNPNDIFNTYSFFDFDYPERPGCDALRTTYYHSATSLSELAVSAHTAPDSSVKITAALLHRWNRNNVDYQLISGVLSEDDVVVGGGVTSDFGGLNLRSELSYFHPVANFADSLGVLAVSAGADYIFGNSLMLQAEVLYSSGSGDSGGDGGGLMTMYAAPLSAKNLSISQWSVFANAAYPLTPRLNASLSTMYFVDMQLYYVGLSVDYSLAENLDFSVITQYFSSLGNSPAGKMQVFLGFMRLKFSF